METLPELPTVRSMYQMAQELARSPVPIVQDNAVLVLAILKELRNHVDPEYCGDIVDYE